MVFVKQSHINTFFCIDSEKVLLNAV